LRETPMEHRMRNQRIEEVDERGKGRRDQNLGGGKHKIYRRPTATPAKNQDSDSKEAGMGHGNGLRHIKNLMAARVGQKERPAWKKQDKTCLSSGNGVSIGKKKSEWGRHQKADDQKKSPPVARWGEVSAVSIKKNKTAVGGKFHGDQRRGPS